MDKAAVKSIIDGLEKNSNKQVEINVGTTGHFELIDPAKIDYVGTETLTFPTKHKGKVFVDIPSITHIGVADRAEEKSEKCDRITERNITERNPERKEAKEKKADPVGLDF